jgi:maltose/moltooligosaccharide transporter
MPNAGLLTALLPALWVGAGMLMIMDASFNIAMEPFRALVADKLSTDQRTAGFAIQTVLIGLGAVIGSWLPAILGDGLGLDWIPTLLVNTIGTGWVPDFLANGAGLETQSGSGTVPANVVWAFVSGAMLLLGAILWTIFTTKEYSPEELAQFDDVESEDDGHRTAAIGFLNAIQRDIRHMPETMKQLGIVQFCSWFALFGMWVYTTPAIAEHLYGLAPNDTASPQFNEAGNQVGVLFGLYNFVSAIYAFALPWIAGRIGRKRTHAFSLLAGGIGLTSIYFMTGTHLLVYSMIGVGMAWASILAMPYAMLAGSIPAKKMGMYMGIFNLFITIPQITNGIVGGLFLKYLYGGQAIFALVIAGLFMIGGAVASLYVKDQDDLVAKS